MRSTPLMCLHRPQISPNALYYLIMCLFVCVFIQTNFSTVFLEVQRTVYHAHFSNKNVVFNVKSAAGVIGKIPVSFSVSNSHGLHSFSSNYLLNPHQYICSEHQCIEAVLLYIHDHLINTVGS